MSLSLRCQLWNRGPCHIPPKYTAPLFWVVITIHIPAAGLLHTVDQNLHDIRAHACLLISLPLWVIFILSLVLCVPPTSFSLLWQLPRPVGLSLYLGLLESYPQNFPMLFRTHVLPPRFSVLGLLPCCLIVHPHVRTPTQISGTLKCASQFIFWNFPWKWPLFAYF